MKVPRLYPIVSALILIFAPALCAGTNVVLWDTGSNPADRSSWKPVPADLLSLEKEPAKASSDPGYYGREYEFAGGIAIGNARYLASFPANSDKITIAAKDGQPLVAFETVDPARTRRFELVRNGADEVVLDVFFTNGAIARFTFGRDEIVEISPRAKLRGFTISSPIDYAVIPGFVGDDLIFAANEEEARALPSDNLLLGLISGEQHALVMTWPQGKQRVRLNTRSISFDNDAKPVYLAILSAPGIWHRETLGSSFLEKDTRINWKPPFSAKWQTQLSESGTPTTYPFRHQKGTVWRGVPGSYNYPVWFEGDTAMFHLSKKVPPKGEAIIYFLEGNDTPPNVLTPVELLKATLGRSAAEPILDVAGRKLRTHHGSNGSGVHRACTCGYTEAIQVVFEKGEEVRRKSFVDQSVSDMIYFVQRHLERIDEYRSFATELTSFLQNRAKDNPELKEYLDEIEQTVRQIPQEYENQKENMKSLAYAGELSKQTLALCSQNDSKNLATYAELLKAWRAMGGAQDYVVAQYHTLTRKLFQDAAYLAATNPKAIDIAQEIRARCKQILRNPDGYEIWPNN
jgi:hypothetical protein